MELPLMLEVPTLPAGVAERRVETRSRILAALREEYSRCGEPVALHRLAALARVSEHTLSAHLRALEAEGSVVWRKWRGAAPMPPQ